MTYSESLRYLNTFLDFEKISPKQKRSWNLKRMRRLLTLAGHPEKSLFTVLIAGTKGKGSTGFFLESILSAHGLSTGFYSSPHLETPRERIRLNGRMLSENEWARQVSAVKKILKRDRKLEKSVTYFEAVTLMAILAFKSAKVCVAILEAGMGGRLDATNASEPQVSVLTPIHLDHEAILGPTIAKIAAEKAAICRPGAPVICAPQVSEALNVIRGEVRRKRALLYIVEPESLRAGLAGDYQQVNAACAIKAAEQVLSCLNRPWQKALAVKAIEKHSAWPGRLELFRWKGRTLLLDAAHNPVSIEALVRNLKRLYPKRPVILIFGTSKDKNAAEMLRTLGGYFDQAVLTRAAHSRSFEMAKLMDFSRKRFKQIFPFRNAAEGLEFAVKQMPARGLIVVTGSFYLIGEARKFLKHHAGH